MKLLIPIAICVFAGIMAILAGRQASAQTAIPIPVAPTPGKADYVWPKVQVGLSISPWCSKPGAG